MYGVSLRIIHLRNTYPPAKHFNIALCDYRLRRRRHGYLGDHDYHGYLGFWTVDCRDLLNVHVVANVVTSIVISNCVPDDVNTNTFKNNYRQCVNVSSALLYMSI